MTDIRLFRRLVASVLVVAAVGLGGASTAHADEKAEEILSRVADYYRGLDELAFDMRMYAMQRSGGHGDEMDLRMSVKVKRPNMLAIDVFDQTESATEPWYVVRSDGERVGVHEPGENRYAAGPAPEGLLDYALVQNVAAGTRGHVSLAVMLMTEDPLEGLLHGVRAKSYEGEQDVDGVNCHIIRLKTHEGVDRVLAIATGEEPYVRQITHDLSQVLAAIRSRGQDIEAEKFTRFENHRGNAGAGEDLFAFTPPEGAERVLSLMPPHPLQGSRAPNFQLERLSGGEVDLASHEGRDVVVIEFWATWCEFCTQLIPTMNEVVDRFEGRDVAFYAVNLKETEDRIEKFLEEHAMHAEHILLDRQGTVADRYLLRAPPFVAVVGKDGVVHWVHEGFSHDLGETLSEAINQALGE